ncbi:MAG: sigma-70 family RNA polymerase sigma factor [Aggregatilineales bacterium]
MFGKHTIPQQPVTTSDNRFDLYMVRLLDRAEEQGFLTIEDLMDVLAATGDKQVESTNGELYNELCRALSDAGVTLCVDQHHALDELIGADDEGTDPESLHESDPETDDSIGLYLKEMSRVPLLSMEEEVTLAQQMESGLRAENALATNAIPYGASTADLELTAAEGRNARDRLIRANTRLVVSVAKKYMGRGVPFLDLIQEGNLGLMKAVEKFDYQRGYRFSTYATWWIRQTISRSIADQGRTIRVPVHMTDRIREMYRTIRQLEQDYGRKPTPSEIAKTLRIEPHKVDLLLRVSWRPLSLDQPVGEDDDSDLSAFIEDNAASTPPQTAQDNILREKIDEVLENLTPREASILRLRFGLLNGQQYTLEEVGEKFGLTRERIRQIEGQALRRLRHPLHSRQLRDFLSNS